MCSVGDSMKLEFEDIICAKFYKCADCSNEFKGIGKKVVCPACHSKNTSLLFKEE
jgi:DNA-directed RNA polymerase subunit RPC12/RpoP